MTKAKKTILSIIGFAIFFDNCIINPKNNYIKIIIN